MYCGARVTVRLISCANLSLRCSPSSSISASLPAPGRFDRGDVDLSHVHHRLESALGRRAIRIGDCVSEGAGRDLPRQAPLVLAPAACAFLSAISDDCVPQAVGFGLVVGRNLERERLAVLELRSTVQADAWDADHGEL